MNASLQEVGFVTSCSIIVTSFAVFLCTTAVFSSMASSMRKSSARSVSPFKAVGALDMNVAVFSVFSFSPVLCFVRWRGIFHLQWNCISARPVGRIAQRLKIDLVSSVVSPLSPQESARPLTWKNSLGQEICHQNMEAHQTSAMRRFSRRQILDTA